MKRWLNRKTIPLYSLCLLALVLAVARGLAERQAPKMRVPETDVSAASAELDAGQEAFTGDFFKDFRAQRETARADELALLDSIVQRENAPEDSVREADARRVQLTRFYEQERGIEKLLIAKGFEDAAAFIQEGSVSVVVKKETLSQSDSDKILEIALRESGQEAANIKVIPVA